MKNQQLFTSSGGFWQDRVHVAPVGKRAFVAEVTVDGETFRELAVCHPEDQFDPDLGYRLALSRALKAAGRSIAREVNREVNKRGKRKR